MNKKFLSFLALGLLMSSSIFAADAYIDSDDEDGNTVQEVTYEALMATMKASIPKDQLREIKADGQMSVATEMVGAQKKKKKKGKKVQGQVLSFEDYYAPLAGEITVTEQTVETMKALLDQYQLTIRPLTKAKNESSKKNPFNKDSQNKLGAYEKAVKQVRAIIQNLKQNSGTAAAAQRDKERAEAEAYFAKIQNAKSEEEAAQRAEEAKQRRAIGTTPARATGRTNAEKAESDAIFDSLMTQQRAQHTAEIQGPIEFPLPQIKPYEEDTTEIFHLIADSLTPEPKYPSAQVHACPACGKINDTPCTIRIAKNQDRTAKEIETKTRHQQLLSDWVEIALDPAGSKQGFDIGGRHASGSPIYDLFCDYAREIQKHPNNTSGSIGLTADRFRNLLNYKFEHVE